MSTTPQKILTCSFCGTFGTYSEHQLLNHIKLQHLGKHCNFCGKNFSTNDYLKAHIATVHQRYICHYCDRSYSRKYSGLKSEKKVQFMEIVLFASKHYGLSINKKV